MINFNNIRLTPQWILVKYLTMSSLAVLLMQTPHDQFQQYKANPTVNFGKIPHNVFPGCTSVRPSVRAHHFRSITWVFIHGFFSNFAYILLSAMSGMGLLMGKIRSFLTELLPFFVLEKWFLACYSFTVHDIWMKLHRYVAHQRLYIVTKDCHSDLPSLWVIRPW